jgi:hypothetical protein
MRSFVIWALLLVSFSGAHLLLNAGQQVPMRFTGNIHEAKADALVSFEQVLEYVLMAGEIQSNGYLHG